MCDFFHSSQQWLQQRKATAQIAASSTRKDNTHTQKDTQTPNVGEHVFIAQNQMQ